MIPARLSFEYEFIPVLTYRSGFVYMIQAQNLYQYKSYRYEVIPVVVPDGNSHNGMKKGTGIM